jgi:ABC-type antimicrobial peptide transport system permease subunit
MFKNYLKIALRNLWRRKGFSALNITGLAVGMASAILILLWINNEYSFDNFHKNKATLYQAWNHENINGRIESWQTTPAPLGPALLQEYPGIASTARADNRWFVTDAGEKKMSSHSLVVDPAFLTMFSYPFLQGDPQTALNNTYSIVLTESMAKKMFGAEPAMSRTIKIDSSLFNVTGILKDLPINNTWDFEFLLPWSYEKVLRQDDPSWGNNSYLTFVQAKPGVTGASLNEQIKDITVRHTNGTEATRVFLHPIAKWHLYSEFENGKNTGGRIVIVRMFSIIAGFILLIACINFMNLSTARSERRAKEVGIRKVAGAYRSLLIGQFLGESILIALLSGILALGLVEVSLPAFDTLVRTQLTIPYNNPYFWMGGLGFILITGLIAGSYPAFFLSSFRPAAVLKGAFKRANAAINPRKVLVVLQFTFAILLIICTFIVTQQIRYAQDRSLGFNRNQLVYNWITGTLNDRYPLMKRELLASGAVTSVNRTSSPLTQILSTTNMLIWKGKQAGDKTDFDRYAEDEDLVHTAGITLSSGRDLDLLHYPTDSMGALINETAVRVMGFKHPIGQILREGDDRLHVVGVIKDFIIGSPYNKVRPMFIRSETKYQTIINFRLATNHPAAENLATIGKIYKKYNPDYPFEYHFVDDDYARKFEQTRQLATLTGLFAGLTIFISCLGLFGLAAYMAENRVKEIGIRKVLGATVLNITGLLTKEFLALVTLSFLIAAPIAAYVLHHWLEYYSYRIGLHWWVFALAGGLSILIALLTVGYQAIAAALINPAKSLRPE